jgi:hypothetical protein
MRPPRGRQHEPLRETHYPPLVREPLDQDELRERKGHERGHERREEHVQAFARVRQSSALCVGQDLEWRGVSFFFCCFWWRRLRARFNLYQRRERGGYPLRARGEMACGRLEAVRASPLGT